MKNSVITNKVWKGNSYKLKNFKSELFYCYLCNNGDEKK